MKGSKQSKRSSVRLGRRRSHPGKKKPTDALVERQATLDRLAVLRRGRLGRKPESATGDNTPAADPVDEIQSAMVEGQELAANEILVSRQRALARAREKIRQGTYGICEGCGRPIPPRRLEALPEAVHCVACAEALEGGRPA